MQSDQQESRAAVNSISRDQVLRFVEQRFTLADHDHDGLLDQNELALFAYSIVCSFKKAQAERHGSFSDSLLNDRSLL